MLRRSSALVIRIRQSLRFNSTEAYTAAITNLKKDLKTSMINKNDLEKNTIKGLLSEIKNVEIDNKSNHNDEFLLFDTYSKLIHQRKDSVENYLANKREDMADKEKKEIDIIKKYQNLLPVSTQEEVDAKVIELLKFIRKEEPTLQLKQVFGKVNWKTTPEQWKTSSKSVRSSIVTHFKSVFQ
ncbi:similar to Saccharomyces cerevisiae YOR215C AIM41 Putative protein of unknown function [Maudiozyma barnettii]|uniref:Altered inheritance of mitochondria protein 41 n=1 Tax=Maudiozyma barnettii TaxID=61262 RepID=A0A8H2VDD5_9SACH|nr:Aim41p [Kazachstania barnettii]CAB4253218.1 similar to Saccharomyces cerevisiae YOR215C AIM41 Putative protein of unknown function [Kazachstania barnettii]CAD1780246.1 similar to Saccharomyces cerevisiae YOR215C AIM41 Putative protein of unknown function [Kazachstania barnettii]